MYEVTLKRGEEKRIMAGHPWVYANEVQSISGKDRNGSLAAVYSSDGRYIGKGYINHLSKILVRIFIRGDETDDDALFLSRIKVANEYRTSLGFSNSYRAVFSESDDLPGLVVDKYGEYLCVQIQTLGMDRRRDTIVKCLVEAFSPKGVYERSDSSSREKEGLEKATGTLYGEVPDEVEIEENGIKILVDLKNGQKTGYFLDQKENRAAARRYCSGSVLDCFCNSGGFSLNVAAGADKVTAADISASALESVRKNAALNGLGNIETAEADVFELLRSYRKERRQFDAVILDPPAFCKSAAEIKDATRGYKDININAMKIVRPGGYLLTSSCTHFMTRTLFEKMLSEAAEEAGRRVRIVETRGQSPDHPIRLGDEETNYLKFYVLQVM